MYGPIHEKDSAYSDNRFMNTDKLRFEYGGNHIWNASVQRQTVIQIYKPYDKTFDGAEIEWDHEKEKREFWTTVDDGLALARE